jgi:small subunit ribosomal protein S18
MSTMTRRQSSFSSGPNDAALKKPMNKVCPFVLAKVDTIDYKDLATLRQFIAPSGKILPRRITGVSFHFQKILKRAIKRARFMALLPFVAED